jgi:hypothetical protein
MGQVYRRWRVALRPLEVTSGEKTKSGSLTALRQNQATGFGMTSLRNGLYGSGKGGAAFR